MLTTQPQFGSPAGHSDDEHLRFILRRLQEASRSWGGAQLEDAELIVEAKGNSFWELIGLRVKGQSGVILGAMRFRRQGSESGFARQSLPSFLAMDTTIDGSRVSLRGLVSLELAGALESVPEFLRRLQSTDGRGRVLVDREFVELAFDLRARNPSNEKSGSSVTSEWQTVVIRTQGGHVLTGTLMDTVRKLRSNLPFIALTRGIQHSIHGNVPLPTLFIQRKYIAMLMEIDEVGNLEEKLNCSSFRPDTANPLHLIFEG